MRKYVLHFFFLSYMHDLTTLTFKKAREKKPELRYHLEIHWVEMAKLEYAMYKNKPKNKRIHDVLAPSTTSLSLCCDAEYMDQILE